ncbi:8-oxo-dGTP diphosphatase MutT [Legionella sp. 27cVA30]|uniref:8-oxo-dGTP diphosphatase MutT n=1 Tax=Legionella sp. 27cVA30 TaxID=2905657 RepID=UPI00209D75F5|nr:8-oxo-dGTP diphosphatase MutT [Legionella sp. 27cVA30]MCP0914418.1 8-oxo-dGTP diphosphatase MutT [Legionella sp. 27cVA30]
MKVAVAVITDARQRILITQRSQKTTHAGYWEFPGGKLEAGEEATLALIREIEEEVGLEVLHYTFLGEVNHTYSQHCVSLLIYHVDKFSGEAYPREGQMDLRWVDANSLQQFAFPAANLEIIKLLKKQHIIYR